MKYIVQNYSTDPHFNMAFDEFCLEQLKADEPVFYLWQNRPSVIIGLNQSAYAEVNLPYLREKGIVLARRVTGGGAVYHDLQNLNYTITGRIRDLETDYPAYVETMARALRANGRAGGSQRPERHPRGRPQMLRLCQARVQGPADDPRHADVRCRHRHAHAGTGHPGSKLSAAGVSSVRSRVANLKEYLPQFEDIQAFQAALQALLAGDDEEIRLTDAQIAQIEADAAAKFRTWEWVYGHSPAAAFRVGRKFACGRVEASFSLKAGCIDGLRFSGDFLGNLPPDRIADALQGCRFTREAIEAVLCKEPVENCFDRLSPKELTALLLDA